MNEYRTDMQRTVKGLNTSLPFYTTRQSANGYTSSYSCSLWMFLLFWGIIWLNVIVWGCIGLYEACRMFL